MLTSSLSKVQNERSKYVKAQSLLIKDRAKGVVNSSHSLSLRARKCLKQPRESLEHVFASIRFSYWLANFCGIVREMHKRGY